MMINDEDNDDELKTTMMMINDELKTTMMINDDDDELKMMS